MDSMDFSMDDLPALSFALCLVTRCYAGNGLWAFDVDCI
jgi:hypothetical protein